jgi:hypothetical protein
MADQRKPGLKPTAPRQSWASKDGLVRLRPASPGREDQTLDRLMIHETFARWGLAWDESQVDVVKSLFTPQAIYQVTQGKITPFYEDVGPEAIAARVVYGLEQQQDQRRHVISNVIIEELSVDRASAMAYGLVTVAADGLTLGATVIYAADLEKGPDGVWRFSRFVIGMDHYAGRRITSPSRARVRRSPAKLAQKGL